MANGSDVIDEGFFRRYRELLDAEDAAFDELEHAYEDGDRAHWDADLAAWRKRRREALRVPRARGPRRPSPSRPSRATSLHERAAPRRRRGRCGPRRSGSRPAITSISVAFQSSVAVDDRRRLAELVVLAEHEQLRARVVRDRAEVGAEPQRRRDRRASREPRRRCVASVMSAPNDQPASTSGSPSARIAAAASSAALHVEELAAAVVVGAGAAARRPGS